VPKCIVHGTGGTLLQHLKEHRLHSDVKAGDRLFYFTTLGWMMWNWLMSGLASGATLLLYDGSPFVGRGRLLFDFADEAGMTHFGTSAKFIDAIAKAGLKPRETHRLEKLRAVLSTGSPLLPEGFDYIYNEVKSDVCLSSISGGTDIVSCFVLGNPTGAVWRGEIQAAGLGMAVEVFDEQGRALRKEKGELVCTRLERPARHEVPRRLLREVPGRLAPRRLVRAHRARRLHHLWPLRHGAQSGGRAHRNRRDLPPGGEPGGRGRVACHRAGLEGRRAGRPFREAARRAGSRE
jgi:acyl-coenzyme A synthetase/AMP-(fatty) acid ligase